MQTKLEKINIDNLKNSKTSQALTDTWIKSPGKVLQAAIAPTVCTHEAVWSTV